VIDVDRDCERLRDFLTGRLTGCARHRFEQRLVRDRSLVSDLEMVAAFREGLLLLRRCADAPQAPAAIRSAGGEWLLGVGAVAALFAAVAVLTTQLPAREILAGATHAGLHFAPRRQATLTFASSRQVAITVDRAAGSGSVELRVQPGAPGASRRFNLVLVRPGALRGAAAIAAIRHLEARADGFVHCYADFAQLASGRYELVLRPEPGSQAPAVRYRIDVVSPAGSAPG
jgi:hypothetical protein